MPDGAYDTVQGSLGSSSGSIGTPAMRTDGRTISRRAGGEPVAGRSQRGCQRSQGAVAEFGEQRLCRNVLLRGLDDHVTDRTDQSRIVVDPGVVTRRSVQANPHGFAAPRTTTPQCSPPGSAALGPAGSRSTHATSAVSSGSTD